jgi:hypothetical protein
VGEEISDVVYYFQDGEKTLSRSAIFIRKSVMYDYSARNLMSVLVKDRCILMLKGKCVLGVIRLVPNLCFLGRESRSINRFWRHRLCVVDLRIRSEVRLRALG